MTFVTRSAPSKTWSAPNKPSGFYVATVTRIENGNEVYVEVPRLTYEFEHGPIVYTGTPLSVGDQTWVGFLEGRQDDVVAPFPGGGGPLLVPDTIEVTLLIASTTSSSGMQGRANFLCNGTSDQVQFLAAADAVQASLSKVGRVVVAEGSYTFDDRLFKAGGGNGFDVEFVGMGVDATLITGDHVGELDLGVIEWFEQGNLAFRNLRFDAFEFDGGDLAPWLIYKDGDGTGSLILDNVQMNSDQGSLVWTDEAFYSRRLKGYSQNGSGITTRNKVWIERADIEANGPCVDFNNTIVIESAVRITRSRFLATQTTAILGNNTSVAGTVIDSNHIETTAPSPCVDIRAGWITNNRLVAASSTTGALYFSSASGGAAAVYALGNDISNGAQPGIVFKDGQYSRIDNNYLRQWGIVGIDVYRNISSDSESFFITDNKFLDVSDGTGVGVRVDDTSFAVIAKNGFYRFDDTAVIVQGASETALVSRNLIVGTLPNGVDKIHIDQSNDVVVDRNHIVEGGIHIEDSSHAQVTNNIQESAHEPPSSYAIKLSGTTNRATVQRNTYTGSRLGGEDPVEDGVLIEAGVEGTRIRDNELSQAQIRVTDNGTNTLDMGLIPIRIEDRSATLTTGTGSQPVPWIGPAVIEGVRAVVTIAPTGSDEVIVDVNVNGSTLWTAQANQPAIIVTSTDSGLKIPEQNATLGDGDIITLDIDQVGDATAGGHLTVTLYIREI